MKFLHAVTVCKIWKESMTSWCQIWKKCYVLSWNDPYLTSNAYKISRVRHGGTENNWGVRVKTSQLWRIIFYLNVNINISAQNWMLGASLGASLGAWKSCFGYIICCIPILCMLFRVYFMNAIKIAYMLSIWKIAIFIFWRYLGEVYLLHLCFLNLRICPNNMLQFRINVCEGDPKTFSKNGH